MATKDTSNQDIKKIYTDIISACEFRIYALKHKIDEEEENETTSSCSSGQNSIITNVTLDIENISDFKRCMELKEDIRKSTDPDLLRAFKDEFQRQLKAYQTRQLLKKAALAPAPSVHRYFKNSVETNNVESLVYSHFDASVNVRQLILIIGQAPTILLAGKDDDKLCLIKVEDMEAANALGDEISESEFNEVWFSNGGFPYVRYSRKARRQLSRVLFKTI